MLRLLLLNTAVLTLVSSLFGAEAEHDWIKDQGYPYRLKLGNLKGMVVCFGKVQNSTSRLIHVAACASRSEDYCPSADECKKSTGYNFKSFSASQISFKTKEMMALSYKDEFFLNLEHKEDDLFNSVFSVGLKDSSGVMETSVVTRAEFYYLRRLLESKFDEMVAIDSATCGKNFLLNRSSKNECLKCSDKTDTCLSDNMDFVRKFINGKKSSEYFLIANLLK